MWGGGGGGGGGGGERGGNLSEPMFKRTNASRRYPRGKVLKLRIDRRMHRPIIVHILIEIYDK